MANCIQLLNKLSTTLKSMQDSEVYKQLKFKNKTQANTVSYRQLDDTVLVQPLEATLDFSEFNAASEVNKLITNVDLLKSLAETRREIREIEKEIVTTNTVVAKESKLRNGGDTFENSYEVDAYNPFMREGLDLESIHPQLRKLLNSGMKGFTNIFQTVLDNSVNANPNGSIRTLTSQNPAYGLLLQNAAGKTSFAVDANATTVVKDRVNESLMLGVVVGAVYGLNDELSELVVPSGRRDGVTLRKIAGLKSNEAIPGDLRKYLSEGGVNANLFAERLGSIMVQTLGIRPKESVTEEEHQKLVSGFGAIGIQLLGEMGILADMKALDTVAKLKETEFTGDAKENRELLNSIQAEERTVAPLSISKGYINRFVFPTDEVRSSPAFYEGLNDTVKIMDEFLDKESSVRGPSFTKPGKRKASVRRQKYANVSELQQESIEVLESTSFTINEGLQELHKLFKGKDKVQELAKRMGHSGVFDYTSNPSYAEEVVKRRELNSRLSKDKSDSIESKDRAIIRTVEQLLALENTTNVVKNNEFYFNWFIGSNDRTQINSNTVNPQSEKELARWLVSITNSKYTVSSQKLNGAFKMFEGDASKITPKDFESIGDDEKVFIYGIVQAFEGFTVEGQRIPAPDAAHFTDVVKAADLLLKQDLSTLEAMVTDVEYNKVTYSKEGHVGQQAVALAAIRPYKDGIDFDTNVVFEADGKTNGLAHKSLQMPQLDYKGYLLKVGIMFEDDVDVESEGSLADVVSVRGEPGKKKSADAYQEMVGTIHDKTKEFIGKLGKDKTFAPIVTAMQNGLAFNFSERELSTALEEITGALRSYAKSSALEGMYVAAISTLIKNKVAEASSKLIDELVENGYVDGKWQSPFGLTEKAVVDMFNTKAGYQLLVSTKKDPLPLDVAGTIDTSSIKVSPNEAYKFDSVQNIIEIFKTENSYSYGNRLAMSNLSSHLSLALNDGINVSMSKFFGTQIEISSTVNNVMDSSFRLFQKAYAEERAKFEGGLTQEDKELLIRKLMPAVPSIRKSSSVFDDERLMLTKEAGKVGQEKPARVQGVYNTADSIYDVANIIVTIFEKDWKKPGAGTLPIATHHKDNDDIISTFLDTVNAKDNLFLMIFDAATISGGNISTINKLNENFIKGNLEYSMLEELESSVRNGLEFLQKTYPEQYTEWVAAVAVEKSEAAKARGQKSSGNLMEDAKELSSIDSELAMLSVTNDDIRSVRKEIFKQPMWIGQFVGMPGSMYKYEPKAVLEESYARHEKAIGTLKNVLSKKNSKGITNKEVLEQAYPNTAAALDEIIKYLENPKNRTDREFRDKSLKLVEGFKVLDQKVFVGEEYTTSRGDYSQALLDITKSAKVIEVLEDFKKVEPAKVEPKSKVPGVSTLLKEIRSLEAKKGKLLREKSLLAQIAIKGGINVAKLEGIDPKDVKKIRSYKGKRAIYVQPNKGALDLEDLVGILDKDFDVNDANETLLDAINSQEGEVFVTDNDNVEYTEVIYNINELEREVDRLQNPETLVDSYAENGVLYTQVKNNKCRNK